MEKNTKINIESIPEDLRKAANSILSLGEMLESGEINEESKYNYYRVCKKIINNVQLDLHNIMMK